MCTNSGNIYFISQPQSAVAKEGQPILPGMAFSMGIPIPLTTAQVRAAQGQLPSQVSAPIAIKQEESEPVPFPRKVDKEAELYNMGVAATVDAHKSTIRAQSQEIEALKRQMASLLNGLAMSKPPQQRDSMAFTANQEVRGKQGQPMIGRAVPSLGPQICYWCGETGHMVRDCPSHKQMVADGWLVWNESANHYILKDGKRLPKREANEFWKDKVTEYAQSKGWTTTADSYFFSGIEEEEEVPSVYHAANVAVSSLDDSSIQRIAAALLQQMQLSGIQEEESKN